MALSLKLRSVGDSIVATKYSVCSSVSLWTSRDCGSKASTGQLGCTAARLTAGR